MLLYPLSNRGTLGCFRCQTKSWMGYGNPLWIAKWKRSKKVLTEWKRIHIIKVQYGFSPLLSNNFLLQVSKDRFRGSGLFFVFLHSRREIYTINRIDIVHFPEFSRLYMNYHAYFGRGSAVDMFLYEFSNRSRTFGCSWQVIYEKSNTMGQHLNGDYRYDTHGGIGTSGTRHPLALINEHALWKSATSPSTPVACGKWAGWCRISSWTPCWSSRCQENRLVRRLP